MSRLRAPSARRSTVVVSCGAAVLAGVVAVNLGWSPALLAVAVLGSLTIGIAQRASFAFAFTASILLMLGVHTLLSRIAPPFGLDYGVLSTAVLAGLGWIALGSVAWTPGTGLRLPGLRDAPSLAGTWLLPGVALAFWMVALGWGPRMKVGWLLANDAVWNTMSARFIVSDGGIDPVSHPNPAPSTAALAATWMIPGRGTAAEVLRHDVAREAQLVLLLVLVGAVLAALVAVRMLPAEAGRLRVATGFAAGGLILGWYVLGFTAELGFLNAPFAIVLLLASWLCFTESRRSPALAASALLVAATLTLGTWAPLVVVPLALAAVIGVRHRRALLQHRGIGTALLVAAAVQLAVYAVAVTLGDLRATGGALAANGAAPPVEPGDVVAVVALAVLAVLAVMLRLPSAVTGWRGGVALFGPPPPSLRGVAVGLGTVLVAAAAGGGYLAWQRVASGYAWWGYYPAKFAWLVCVLVLVVAIGLLGLAVARLRIRPLRIVAATVAVGLVCATVATSLPLGGLRRVAAPIALVADAEYAARAAAAERLFLLADSGRTITVRTGALAADDALVNSWLLQSYSERSEDPVRAYAYGFDPADLTAICGVVATWGGGVRILTADDLLADELGAVCPDAGYEVVVSS